MYVTYSPVAQPQARFGTRAARSFPYEKYADLMVNYSVGGVKPAELCLVKLSNQRLSEKTLTVIQGLYKQGYNVHVNAIPGKIEAMIQAAPIGATYRNLVLALDRNYTAAFQVKNSHPKIPELQALLKRRAVKGESIKLTVFTTDSDKLAEGIIKRVIAQGGIPYLRGGNRHLDEIAQRYAYHDDQLSFVPPDIQEVCAHMSKLFSVSNPYDDEEDPKPVRILGGGVPKIDKDSAARRKQLALAADGALQKVYTHRMRRIEMDPDVKDGFFRTLGISPSKAVAKECGMDLEAFGRFYKAITKMNLKDPIRYFREMDTIVGHYASQLQKFHTLRVYREDGKTDLTFSIRDKGATQSRYVAPSTATGNALPAEIFTSPVEDSVNGKLYLDIPFYLESEDKTFQGLHLTFKKGKVVSLNVEKGDEDLLRSRIIEGHEPKFTIPGFNVLGEFAIGFNRKITELMKNRATKNTLIAEKQDLHFALGSSYAVTGGKNECALHEDIPGRSGPKSGLHIEGWADEMKDAMPIYDEGLFTDAFLTYQTPVRVKNTDFFLQ